MGGCLPLTHVRMGRDQKDGIVKVQQVESPGQWEKNAQCELRVKLFNLLFFLYLFGCIRWHGDSLGVA